MMSPTVMRGFKDAYGSWKMICISLRSSRISSLRSLRMSRPLNFTSPEVGSMSRRISRPVVDLPQPLSPTNPSVSPGLVWKLLLSTALTEPNWREKMIPFVMGKCLTRFLTSKRGAAACAWPISAHLLLDDLKVRMLEARGQMPAAHVHQRRLVQLADGLGVAAPGVEPAPFRHVEGAGHDALDGLQPLLIGVQARQGAQEPFRVRVLRVAEQRPDVGPLHDLASVHDDDLVHHLRDDAQIVGDEDDGGPELILELAHQVQNLRLNGHVQRRGRFVGEDRKS